MIVGDSSSSPTTLTLLREVKSGGIEMEAKVFVLDAEKRDCIEMARF